MTRVRQWLASLRQKRQPAPPAIPVTIDGQDRTVTEWCRRQAAANMAHDPAKKAEVVALLEAQNPGRGEELARRRYPEAWSD